MRGFATDRVGGRVALSSSLVGLAVATYAFCYSPTRISRQIEGSRGFEFGFDTLGGAYTDDSRWTLSGWRKADTRQSI